MNTTAATRSRGPMFAGSVRRNAQRGLGRRVAGLAALAVALTLALTGCTSDKGAPVPNS